MSNPTDVVKQIKNAARRKFSADDKIRIVLEGLRGEITISELCRREGLAASIYYKWSKEFLEAGKNGLTRSIWPDWFKPCRAKKKLIQTLLTRINNELFGRDKNDHRITLFKEVCYLRALLRNYWYFPYHLFRIKGKRLLYLRPPKPGRYLVVNSRCGRCYKKSSTMFRVEENDEKKCEGVVGYIRLKGLKMHVTNLPDIQSIDLSESYSVEDLSSTKRRDVKRYMKDGFVSNFCLLKKIHRKARHFNGTVVEGKDGETWGVLLVDSTATTNPFDEEVIARFDSFALTISNIIQMEV